jgi:hypothetical protein
MNAVPIERRSGVDRRRKSFRAFWYGALNPRRRGGRRATDVYYPIVDWHSPRVFAWVFGILVLCACDGVLTVLLLSLGAQEANPFMALFVPHSLGWFAAIKLGLTSIGAMVLAACSRMKLFRTIPGEALLVAILLGYVVLIVYELRLLESLPD